MTLDSWHDFYSAQVAASSALAGLLFVAISVNLARIMQLPWLPSRAGQTLVVLTGALVVSSIQLVPFPSSQVGAWLTAGASFITLAFGWRLSDAFSAAPPEWRARPEYVRHTVTNVVALLLATLPAFGGGIAEAAGNTSGSYGIAAGIVLALIFGLFNSWVLLVEILR